MLTTECTYRFIWFLEQPAIIYQLIFVMEMGCVFFVVRTKFLNINDTNYAFKGFLHSI